jgi:hypothetical protein
MGDAHVYKDHVEPLKEQLGRTPREFPTFKFARTKEEIGDIDGFKTEDFIVEGYKPMGKIDMKMSVSVSSIGPVSQQDAGLIFRHRRMRFLARGSLLMVMVQSGGGTQPDGTVAYLRRIQ